MKRTRLLIFSALWLFSFAVLGQESPLSYESAFDLRWGVRIPMRDGVELNATLYVPRHLDGKAAAIFNMTPYRSTGFHPEAAALARRGFVFAAIDVRGRGNSQGRFEPWRNDGRDGYDVAEWLARQPWSSGKVGMMGHSYGGRAVWSTLKEAPPHLMSAVPLSASYPMRSWHNIQGPEAMQWILLNAGVTSNSPLLADPRFWKEKYLELYLSGRPLRDFDLIIGYRSELHQTFLDHPALDDFWDAPTPGPEDFRRLKIPILTVVGANEYNAPALWYYDEHRRVAPPEAATHYLVIGPWSHRGTLRPSREVGGLVHAPQSEIDMKALLADWFDHTLRGAARPAFLEAPVRYYVAGAAEWRSAGTYEEAVGTLRSFALASDGAPLTLAHPGRLLAQGAASGSDAWTYDPLDTRPGLHEPLDVESWITELSWPDDLYGAGVAYATAPFGEPTDLVGRSRLTIFLSLDVPDTDLAARLDLVTARGETILLGEDTVRVRYRHSLQREELLRSTDPVEIRFVFPFSARTLPAGSRLRIIVRSPSSLVLCRHFNSDRPVADQSADDARTAHIRLLHDAEHPSRLQVPLSRP